MTTMEWLEPAIKQSIENLVDDCCENNEVKLAYENFMQVVESVKSLDVKNDKLEVALELEHLFNTYFRLAVDLAYRAAFQNALDLAKSFRADGMGVKTLEM